MNVAKIQSLEKATLDPFIKKPLLLGKGQTKQSVRSQSTTGLIVAG